MRVLTSVLIGFYFAILSYPAQAELLQGGVEHKEFLPQMSADAQPGNPYLTGQAQSTSIVWYPLPKWLMGMYESDYITNQVVRVYSASAPQHGTSGQFKHTEGFGVQLDKTGRAWHADFLPHESIWQGALKEIQTTIEKECTFSNDERIVLHIHNHCIYVNPETNQIDHVDQVDGFKTITLKDDQGNLAVYDDIQEYDRQGRPLDRYVATFVMHRIKTFEPLNSFNGTDLRPIFANYLASIGHSELIPTISGDNSQQIPLSTSSPP
jgi:hypothetical protein